MLAENFLLRWVISLNRVLKKFLTLMLLNATDVEVDHVTVAASELYVAVVKLSRMGLGLIFVKIGILTVFLTRPQANCLGDSGSFARLTSLPP